MLMTGLTVCFIKGRRLLRLPVFSVLLAGLGLAQGMAYAKENAALLPGVVALLKAHPAGSIDSVEKADEVREAVAAEKQVLDGLLGKELDACVKKFLVSRCYEETRLRFRRNHTALLPLSAEADRFKRHERVRLRDEALLDARKKEQDKMPEREAARRKYEEKEEKYLREKAAAAAAAADTTAASIQQEASSPALKDGTYTVMEPAGLKHPDTALTPEKRAMNVRDYEEKKLESERKQENVQRKLAETQVKRDRRAEEAAKKRKKKQKVADD